MGFKCGISGTKSFDLSVIPMDFHIVILCNGCWHSFCWLSKCRDKGKRPGGFFLLPFLPPATYSIQQPKWLFQKHNQDKSLLAFHPSVASLSLRIKPNLPRPPRPLHSGHCPPLQLRPKPLSSRATTIHTHKPSAAQMWATLSSCRVFEFPSILLCGLPTLSLQTQLSSPQEDLPSHFLYSSTIPLYSFMQSLQVAISCLLAHLSAGFFPKLLAQREQKTHLFGHGCVSRVSTMPGTQLMLSLYFTEWINHQSRPMEEMTRKFSLHSDFSFVLSPNTFDTRCTENY